LRFGVVQKEIGQPLTGLAMPKAQIFIKFCSFWPTSGPKTAFNKNDHAFGIVNPALGCPKTSFWTAPKLNPNSLETIK
jgi:hypothetical protein